MHRTIFSFLFVLTLSSLSAEAIIRTALAYKNLEPELCVSGTVYDSDGAVLIGAVVELRAVGMKAAIVTVTDENGLFYFKSVPSGDWRITVEFPGYLCERQTISILMDNPQHLVFALSPEMQTGNQEHSCLNHP